MAAFTATGSPLEAASAPIVFSPTAAGPLGGTVTKLIEVDGKVWASLYSGGVYELAGDTWQQIAIFNGFPETRAQDLVVDPSDPNKVYAPQHIACATRTLDGGATWDPLCDVMLPVSDSPNFTTKTLALDPQDPSIIYAPGWAHDGTSMLLVSEDAGDSWERRYTWDEHIEPNQLVFFEGRMYLGTRDNGVQMSDDGGATWRDLSDGLEEPHTIRFAEFDGDLYLVGGQFVFNTRTGGCLYRLDGETWVTAHPLCNFTSIHDAGTTLWLGTGEGAVMKMPAGGSPTEVTSEGIPSSVFEILVQGSTIYVAVHSEGIFRSVDGGATFTEFNSGLKALATREVHVNPKDPDEIYVLTWDRPGMYRSRNAGKSYKRIAKTYGVLTAAPDPRRFTRFFAGGYEFIQGTYTDKGLKIVSRPRPGAELYPDSFVKALAVHPANSDIILAGVSAAIQETPPGYGVWYSTDRAKTWKHAQGIGDNAVHSIIFHPTKPRIVYAAALGGGVYKSSDTGKTFTRIGQDAGPDGLMYTYRLAMSPSDPKHLLAGSNLFFGGLSPEDRISGDFGGIWETKDGGQTWTELTAGIRDYPAPDLPSEDFEPWLYNFGHLPDYEQMLIDPNDPDHLIIGHHGQNVVTTSDGGATWNYETQGMIPEEEGYFMHNYAYCLGQSASGDRLYVCTCGRGLWKGDYTSAGKIRWSDTSTGQSERSDPTPPPGPPSTPEDIREVILLETGAHPH